MALSQACLSSSCPGSLPVWHIRQGILPIRGATCCVQSSRCRSQACTIRSLMQPGTAADLPVPAVAAQSPPRPGWSWQRQLEGHRRHPACSSGTGLLADPLVQSDSPRGELGADMLHTETRLVSISKTGCFQLTAHALIAYSSHNVAGLSSTDLAASALLPEPGGPLISSLQARPPVRVWRLRIY